MIKLMIEDYLEDYPYWRSVTVPIEDKQLFIDGIHELGLDWKLGHEDGNGRIGLKIYCEHDDLVNLADYVDSRKAKTESIGRKKLREQDVEIEVKNKGILEVPEDKNVDDLPMSHFEKLVKKHGLSKITKALNNLQVWNKNDDKKLSKWAGDMIDKLTKKYGKNESINNRAENLAITIYPPNKELLSDLKLYLDNEKFYFDDDNLARKYGYNTAAYEIDEQENFARLYFFGTYDQYYDILEFIRGWIRETGVDVNVTRGYVDPPITESLKEGWYNGDAIITFTHNDDLEADLEEFLFDLFSDNPDVFEFDWSGKTTKLYLACSEDDYKYIKWFIEDWKYKHRDEYDESLKEDYIDGEYADQDSLSKRYRELVANGGTFKLSKLFNRAKGDYSKFVQLAVKNGFSKIDVAAYALCVDDQRTIHNVKLCLGIDESLKEDYITVDGISYDEYEIYRKYHDIIRSDKVDKLHGIYYDVGGNEDEFIIDAIDGGFSKLDIMAFLMYAVEDSLSLREIKGLFKSLNISLKESSMYDYYDVPDGAFDMHNDMPTEEDEMWSELSTKQREIVNALEELGYNGNLTRFFSKIIGSWAKVYDTDKSTSSGVEITVDLDGKVTVQEFVYAVDEEDLTDLSPVKVVKSAADVKKLDSWAKRIKKHDISF